MKVYIAGPMTGLPELNFPAFHREAANLRAQGIEVVNPAEINADPNAKWVDCMRADIRELVTCDVIAMLPGWDKSKGATLEHHIAKTLELRVVYLP
jgi:nucleoside 2-deoxyribosyltransferase